MSLRFLLDTHVFVRWVAEPRRLSRNQQRVLQDAEERFEEVGLATISLLEIALLGSGPKPRLEGKIEQIFETLRQNPTLQLLPISMEVAQEIADIGDYLRDPMDRAIVATARVHGLTLLTSDERIVDSKLVRVID